RVGRREHESLPFSLKTFFQEFKKIHKPCRFILKYKYLQRTKSLQKSCNQTHPAIIPAGKPPERCSPGSEPSPTLDPLDIPRKELAKPFE
ncbi:MAG TPA: hypothetical protein PLV33_05330, partial [Opitutaceae bacterium]|nr:hypothetical protein [Opitutaceae bacterium]HOR24380.1 hypothetical protein [Opitutaceae bacterium]HOY55611.1 hypothetical protein [Opitutaceae bacterium]HPG18532.1 hypothetical protein [Opitutaceae bacterium]HPK49226.1 hypothetical protein [Opitutaceae bacterium]